MKKVNLSICLIVLAISAIAQTTKGTLSVGGGIRYMSSENYAFQDIEIYEVSIRPNVGYFVKSNLEFGLDFSVGFGKREYKSFTVDEVTKTKSFGVGPFARYYLFTSNERFAFIGQVKLMFSNWYYNDDEETGNVFDLSISPGFTYFLSDKWGLDFMLQGINYTKAERPELWDTYSLSIGAEFFNPTLGFRYYISR